MSANASRITGESQLLSGIGSYKGKIAASMGDVARSDGALALATAQQSMADATLTKNLATAQATRSAGTVAGLTGFSGLFNNLSKAGSSSAKFG
jgi:hypothetical protein